jgi:hypothetical protein
VAPGHEEIVIFKISEYDMINDLQALTDNELYEIGYTQEQINELRAIDYDALLRSMQKTSESKLKDKGYSDAKIAAVKSYSGTEAEMRAAAATLIGTYSPVMFSYANGKTTFSCRLSWNWDTMPVWTFHDIVACSISENMYYNSESYHQVSYYYPDNYNQYYKTIKYSMKPDAPTGIMSNTFDMNLYNTPGGEKGVAKYGYAFFKWDKMGSVPEVAGFIKYGHAIFSITPSISLGADGISFSIEPGLTINEDYNNYYHEYR